MEIGNWCVSDQGRIKRVPKTGLMPNIVFVDDHSLYRASVRKLCLDPFLSKMGLIEFDNGDNAYKYLVNEILEGRSPGLLLTDINHPGMRGNDLVKSIRLVEKEMDTVQRLPIVILSMVPETVYPELITKKIVDIYLTKVADSAEIIDGLKRLLK